MSTENKPIRVGIVGAGRNTTTRHIPGLRAIDGVQIVSLVNRSPESSQRVAQAFDIPITYASWHDLVLAEDTNAIVIGTWPYMHHPVTVAALEAGKHVMVEARMAMNYAEAQAMLALSQANPQLVAQVVPSPMTLHLDATIKRLLAEGYIGDPVAVDVRVTSGFADFDAPIHWRQEIAFSGGNIMGMGIWYEAIMRWLGEATAVMALGKTTVKMRPGPGGQPTAVYVPDHVNINGQMACGAQLSMLFSDVAGVAGHNGVSLHGTSGTLRFSNGKLYGGQRGDSVLAEIPIKPEDRAEWRVEEEFIGAIRGQETIKLTSFAIGTRYMAFTDAVNRSLKSGRLEPVPR